MKRLSLLLALVMLFMITGCCFAPGYEGSPIMSMQYTVPAWTGEDYSFWEATEPAGVSDGLNVVREPLPAPEVDLEALPQRLDSDFVKVTDYIPDVFVELRYATKDNLTGKEIYEFTDVYLRYGTVKKLMEVQQDLREKGLLLKIWDGFRPVSAQFALWEAYPNAKYVANPEKGYSSHSYGNTVDVTVVDGNGNELEMPTDFDDFTVFADRDYSDCPELAAANAQMLQDIMEKHGFVGYESEWWHYSDETEYAVEECIDPAVIAKWYAECNEYINMRVKPDVNAEVIGHIKADEQMTVLGWVNRFAYVEYEGQRGYVNGDYIKPVQ